MTVVDGVETRTVLPPADVAGLRDPETGERGVRARVYAEDGGLRHSRHLEVAELEDDQVDWLSAAARIELEAVVDIAEPTRVSLGARGPGRWHVTAPGHDEEFVIDYHQGPGGGFFRPNSHATTVMLEPGAVVRASVHPGELPRILGLVLTRAPQPSSVAISQAARAAQGVDTAVVVVGLTPDQETEGQDKSTLALPGDQDALVAAVASAARRTVVVVNAATPVLMPWLDLVDAVLFAGLPGQEAGHAVAAALTGEHLPEGRLVTTFPLRDGEGPAWSVRPRRGDLAYTDGVAVGYRGWDQHLSQPAFWFGHGLGYTQWRYSRADVEVDADRVVDEVRTWVENTGAHPGRETVQVYLRPHDATQPVRLIGWAQVSLNPGESAEVRVDCDRRVQRWWDPQAQTWQLVRGAEVLLARGLGDVRARIPLPTS